MELHTKLLISNVSVKRKTYQRFSEAVVHLGVEVEAVCETAGGRRTACFDGRLVCLDRAAAVAGAPG
jgi:hypothetical protein